MEGPVIGLIVLACFFAVAFLVACYYIVDRLGGIEEGIEKVSILMTVMANKQGATDKDISDATSNGAIDNKKNKE